MGMKMAAVRRRIANALGYIGILGVLSLVVASPAVAIDSPHNSIINCGTCHPLREAVPSIWWTDQGASGGLCGQCHNPSSGLDDAVSHNLSARFGSMSIQCSTCHDPHFQRQLRSYTPASYLLTGTISSVDTSTGAWIESATPLTPGVYTGMLLVPDIASVQYNYRIIGNDATRITIDTNFGPLNLAYAQAGKTFGVSYGKLVRQALNGRTVKFFNRNGQNSFADTDTLIDGVCQVCHTQTSVFNQSGALNDGNHPENKAGTNCISCHSHSSSIGGFRANCGDCHGSPPAVATLGGPDGLPGNEGGTGSTTAGGHQKHAVTLSYTCEICHTGGMPESDVYNRKVQLGFKIANGSYLGGTYDGRSSLSNGYVYETGDAGLTTITQNGSLTCANIYCHSNAKIGTPVETYATPAWNAAGPLGCSSCHGSPPSYPNGGAGAVTANSHPVHVQTNIITCDKCHNQTALDNASIRADVSPIKHADGNMQDVFFDPATSPSGSYAKGTKTCSAIYCHGNTSTPQWGASSLACDGCHNASSALEGKHSQHYATSVTATSRSAAINSTSSAYIFTCGVCHSPASITHAGGAASTNQAAEVSFDAAIAGGGTYTPAGTLSGTDKGFNWTAGSCVSVYCHSNAAPAPNSDPAKSEPNEYKMVAWNGTSLTCYSCHKGTLSDTTAANCSSTGGTWDTYCTGPTVTQTVCATNGGTWDATQSVCRGIPENTCSVLDGRWVAVCTPSLTMTSNGHERLAGPKWIRKYPCTYCHNGTVDANGSIIDRSKHVNGSKNVVIASQWGIFNRPSPVYDPANGCSNVYCHSDGTTDPGDFKPFKWTQGKTECNTCHGHPLGSCNSSSCHDGTYHGDGQYWEVKTGWLPGEEWKSSMPMFPNQGAGTARANSHPRHLLTDFTCNVCHAATIKNGECTDCHTDGIPSGIMGEVAHIDPAYHVNKTKDVTFKDGGSYNLAAKTCSNTACHTGGTDPVWGGSVNDAVICLNCHGTTGPDADDFGAFNGVRAGINLTDWMTTGHGRPASAGNYPSGNPPANFPGNPCWYCHDNTVLHKDSGNPFRLKQHNQFGQRFEKECVYCHMQGVDAECLNCHNTAESLAPKLQDLPADPGATWPDGTPAPRPDHGAYTNGATSCITSPCHYVDPGDPNYPKNDLKRHNTGAGLWTADQKADIKNQYLMMGVCLQCHDDDREGECIGCHTGPQYILGYDPGTGFIKPAKARASSVHFGYKHYEDYQGGQGWRGGKFCWDCHDPHGDNNIYMIQNKVATSTDGTFGKPLTRADVVFTKKQSGLDYARTSPPYNGICNVCHSNGGQHYRADYGDGHNAGRVCTTCHEHRFTDSHSSGSPCISCHLNKPVPRHSGFGLPRDCTKCHNGTINKRMDIMGQLRSNSHHVQGVTVNNKHCYACHWEATELGLINIEHHEGYNYKTHATVKDAKVDLVVWGPGTRSAIYGPATVTTFLASNVGTPNERGEVDNVTKHCLGCHSDQNNDLRPFDDCKTPRQYAWDRQSIASRYATDETTTWGKYTSTPNASKKNITKAFSAHGNAQNNFGGGWDATPNGTGNDGGLLPTRGGADAKSVQCYDCHSSHGSKVTGITSSYVTFNGTMNGGNLKETQAGKGGYSMTYKASSNTSGINPYNAGAGQCFDCHETQNAGTTPWGYQSTFGATAAIKGYMDTPRMGAGAKGKVDSSPFRKTIVDTDTNMGGHLKRSGAPLDHTPEGEINGLCTPCHDPHGISKSLGSDMAYAVPLLKGTWLTSPYKEDRPLAGSTSGVRLERPTGDAVYPNVHTDQRTFGAGNWISEDDSKFAGLCLRCHPKSSLTDGINDSLPWKGRDRVHESVKGWGDNQMHAYSCSKCHQPHVAALPRLMQTNCLDFTHRGRVASGGKVSDASGGYNHTRYFTYSGLDSSGSFPKGFSGNGNYDVPNYRSNCHPTGVWPDNSWNARTPW